MDKQNSNTQFITLLWVKAWLNLKSEINKTYLSYLWLIIEPALYIAVFYVLFGIVLERGGPGFIWYLLSGLIPYQWFAKSVSESSQSIIEGRGLMQSIRITPYFFPLAKILKTALKQIPVFLVLFIALSFGGDDVSVNITGAVVMIFIQSLFIVGFCFFVSTSLLYIRDLMRVIPIFLQFMLFGSGVFYASSRIPEEWQFYFFLNPIATMLSQYRRVFVEGLLPQPMAIGYIIFISGFLFATVFVIYKFRQSDYSRMAIQ